MICTKCSKQNLDTARFCTDCGHSLNGGSSAQAEAQSTNVGTRDQAPAHDLIYPKNPPLSPQICWTSFLLVGVAQMIFGQVAKGVSIFIAACFIGILTGGLSFFVVAPLAIIDAYKLGVALRDGRAVGKWQFFP